MVTRRFKKGSVYDTLASSSGLDFSPVVQLKTYNPRREDSSPKLQPSKPPDKPKEKLKSTSENCPSKKTGDNLEYNGKEESKDDSSSSSNMNPTQQPSESKQAGSNGNINFTCIAAHEKYPSWPVVNSESPSVSHRSHSWTGQTDYPKEKISYSRPKKDNQYKISTNQLQPVLERSSFSDCGNSNKTSQESVNSPDRLLNGESYRNSYRASGRTFKNCSGKQFDFEAFHTPCIPQCYEDKDFTTHSPPERDDTSPSTSRTKNRTDSVSNDVAGFCGIYEDVFQHEAQYTAPLSSTWSKLRSTENKNVQKPPDTPFLDRLRMENAWQVPPPPAPVHQSNVPSLQRQQLQPEQQELLQQAQQQQQQGNDFELSSENGTWMGSMESSCHGKSIPKWQGSYSDLSTLSTQLSNRSSLFDSGHSTMPESGRLSPQSSCDSTAASLLLEVPTRAQVVARHGCHREIVAHSARVQQPERYGSESVLYYATGSQSRLKSFDKMSQKNVDSNANAGEDSVFRSHASLTLSPSLPKSNFIDPSERRKKCPTRQDSRNSSNSFSSDDSYPRFRCPKSEDTSGSSSDVSNITCISNYASSTKLQRKNSKSSPVTDNAQHQTADQSLLKYKLGYESLKSKSIDETSRKPIFSEVEKRQRISDPELKAIQKKAVMSFYQRMSLAESIKSDSKPLIHLPPNSEPPPPYESTARLRASVPKLSLLPNKSEPSSSIQTAPQKDALGKICDSRLSNNYSKSVPNLVILKGQSLDLPPSHPFFKQSYNSSQYKDGAIQRNVMEKRKGYPLVKDEIISWDQLPNVLEKKREAFEKASPEENGGCTSSLHYLKAHKSPRKVQLKEVHHSNETASVQVMTPEGVTLVQTNEKKAHKRRPAPPPPPKQPPRRPPPPPPPITPPLTNVIVEGIEDSVLLSEDKQCPSSPDLPLPPPPTAEEVRMMFDESTPPPDAKNVDIPPRTLDGTSLIYPKNSYMSYRSERKLARQGFDGKYRQSFHTSASSVDLATIDSSFPDENNSFSPNSWELIHNIRPQGTTVIFHSNCIQQNGHSQKSNSQNSVVTEETEQNISNCTPRIDTENNESSPGNQSESSKAQHCVHRAVPYNVTSQEEVKSEICYLTDSHQTTDKKTSVTPNDTIVNCEIELNETLDNNLLNDSKLNFSESRTNVDHNQNSLKFTIVDEHASETLNGNDCINRINSSTQTTDTPKLYRKLVKTQEELACERLSRDFILQYGDIALKHLFVPASNHKTLSDYMESLWSLDFEASSQSDQLNSVVNFVKPETNHEAENMINDENYFESNAKICEMNDNKNEDHEIDLKKKKEELIVSIEKKLDSLREEQTNIRTEMLQNDKLGQEITQHLQQIARPSETEKYTLHVEEQEKIVNLLLSLSGRLARAENILRNLPENYCIEEKKILESKRNKLKEQHDDACRLKESIDRRSNNISTFLHKYFSDEEYAKYDRFMKMKTKFLIDIREMDEKINLGEEQLAALKVAAHLWKSANS